MVTWQELKQIVKRYKQLDKCRDNNFNLPLQLLQEINPLIKISVRCKDE